MNVATFSFVVVAAAVGVVAIVVAAGGVGRVRVAQDVAKEIHLVCCVYDI